MIEPNVYWDMPDDEYHKQYSREEHYYSSSQLKTMLEDPHKFHREYILNKPEPTPQAMQDAFDVGTIFHTAILEPDKLKGSFVNFKGGQRRGKVWDDFKERHKDKIILTEGMLKDVKQLRANYEASELCKSYLEGGEYEVSFFIKFHGVNVKVRTDCLHTDYIVDPKSTKGYVHRADMIKQKIKTLNYDLSAALYLDVVNACIDHFELDIPHKEKFYWIFASKDKKTPAQLVDAENYIEMGRAKYMKALNLIKKFERQDWELKESIMVPRPPKYELNEWVKPKEDDSELL
jgi:hypothetical protein